jgi:glycosyltransferase involved in cell wall biosynthesis
MTEQKPKARRARRAGVIDGTEMEVLQINENPDIAGKCVGTIAMITRDNVSAQTAISWLMTDMSFCAPGEYIKRYIVQGNVLVFQRNDCIARMDGDWILFIDSDMVWQPSDIKTIVETRDKFDLDIVGGLCFQRGSPHQPTLYVEGNKAAMPEVDANWSGYTFMEDWPEDTAVEVDATGMAFYLVHKRVFDRILRQNTGEGFPPLEVRNAMAPPPFFLWDGVLGEDFRFCRDAKAAGCQIFVDTAVKIGHVGQQVITEETFLRELAFRRDDEQKFRELQLASVGHKALTREKAREKLGVTW